MERGARTGSGAAYPLIPSNSHLGPCRLTYAEVCQEDNVDQQLPQGGSQNPLPAATDAGTHGTWAGKGRRGGGESATPLPSRAERGRPRPALPREAPRGPGGRRRP